MTRTEQRGLTFAAVALCGLFLAELLSNYTPVKASMLLVLLFWIPLLVLHEAAHALAARWVGWQVQEVVIGFGKELTRFRIGNTLVRIRLVPIEGYILPTPISHDRARLKSAFIYLAGPGSELLLVALLWMVLGEELTTPSAAYSIIAAQSLALGALMGAGFNLLPYATGNGVSDGLGAILSLFASEELFRHRLSMQHVRAARQALYLEQYDRAEHEINRGLETYPGDELLRGLAAVVAAGRGEHKQAIAQLEELGHPNDKPAAIRHELLLDAAWVVLLNRDQTLLRDAEQACERALIDAADSVRANLMLGRVLLERDQPEAAFKALMHAYRQTVEAEDEPQLLAYLSIAARRIERLDYADRFLSVLDPQALGVQLRRQACENRESP
jgi:tetratricopeptide (TPR) repeat protein